MSRLGRYKDSLDKFLKERSCLYNTDNDNIKKIIDDNFKKQNLLLSILFLTIMNSRNKKNNVSMQGYYGASCINILNIIVNVTKNKDTIIQKYGYGDYHKTLNYLIICSNKSLFQNIETLKNNVSPEMAINIYIKIMEIYHKKITALLEDIKIESKKTLEKKKFDLLKWYIRDDKNMQESYKSIEKISKKDFHDHLEKKIGCVCELTMCIGWLLGCGDIKSLDKIKNIAKDFTIVIKIANDFNNLESDILNKNNFNYIINYGLQDAHELFMDNKQQFIEKCMLADIYTATIKEIINYLEKSVDDIIDETSPDLKSSFTTCSNISFNE